MNEKKSMLTMIIAAAVLIVCAAAVYYFNRPAASITSTNSDQANPAQTTEQATEQSASSVSKAADVSTDSASTNNNLTNTNTAVRVATGTNKTMDTKELKMETIKAGNGAAAKSGDTVTVNYVGTLTDGTKFDSSLDRHQPFSFTLGAGQVIKGWDLGVAGMKVGEERKLTIPSDLGYGDAGVGPIPGKATLIFDVTLLKIGN